MFTRNIMYLRHCSRGFHVPFNPLSERQFNRLAIKIQKEKNAERKS